MKTAPAESTGERLAAIDRYINLRDWSFALIDLIEVAGETIASDAPIEVPDRTLMEISGLLRDLLQQMDARVDVIREGA